MTQVPRQLQRVPVGSKNTRSRRVDIRHKCIENPARLQPFPDLLQHLSGVIDVFEYVKTCDYVKGFWRKGSRKNIAREDLCTASDFGLFCRVRRHFYSVELPWSFLQTYQEGP